MDKNCVICKISKTAEVAEDNLVRATTITSATLEIDNVKRFISVVTCSVNNKIIFLKNI